MTLPVVIALVGLWMSEASFAHWLAQVLYSHFHRNKK